MLHDKLVHSNKEFKLYDDICNNVKNNKWKQMHSSAVSEKFILVHEKPNRAALPF